MGSLNEQPKRILVIGGTGAQGSAVVKALLAAKTPYAVRILSRDPDAPSVKEAWANTGVELVKGSFMDIESVRLALQDCYGLYLNIDGQTVKEADEIWASIRIWEISKRIPTLRHFVYSSIDYYLKLTDFNPKYASLHTNAKGRVNEYLYSQPSSNTEEGLAWSILITGAYDEMLYGGLFAPQIQEDGTRVFAMPLGDGNLPLQSLKDLSTFARIMFEDRKEWSGKTLNSFSHFAGGQEIVETLKRVAGVKAVYKPITYDEWIAQVPYANTPMSSTDPDGPTFAFNFRMWWQGLADSVLLPHRDREALKKIHPGLQSLEDWMIDAKYDGTNKPLIKNYIDDNRY